MLKRWSSRINSLLFLSDMLLTAVALFLAARSWHYALEDLPPLVYGLALGVWGSVFLFGRLYFAPHYNRLSEQLKGLAITIGIALLAFAGLLHLTNMALPRPLLLRFFALNALLLVGDRVLLWFILSHPGKLCPPRRIVVLGTGKAGREFVRQVVKGKCLGEGLEVVGFLDDDPDKQGKHVEGIPVLGPMSQVVELAKERKVDDVVFALPLRAFPEVEKLVLELQRFPVRVGVVPDFYDLAFIRPQAHDLAGIPMIGLREPAISEFELFIKRAFDLVFGTLLLIVSAPLMLLIALSIKLDSPGPAIFRQQRVGENGRLFWMYKFRSMAPDAERRLHEVLDETPDGQLLYKRPDDPRITRVGRWLRRTSLDELPQLFNVLKGEMSLVGPRPELPFIVDRYERWQLQRFSVPPGITGWWQVNGRSDRPMHLHTEDDLYYIRNYSLWLDLKILWKTIWVVLKGQGAY